LRTAILKIHYKIPKVTCGELAFWIGAHMNIMTQQLGNTANQKHTHSQILN